MEAGEVENKEGSEMGNGIPDKGGERRDDPKRSGKGATAINVLALAFMLPFAILLEYLMRSIAGGSLNVQWGAVYIFPTSFALFGFSFFASTRFHRTRFPILYLSLAVLICGYLYSEIASFTLALGLTLSTTRPVWTIAFCYEPFFFVSASLTLLFVKEVVYLSKGRSRNVFSLISSVTMSLVALSPMLTVLKFHLPDDLIHSESFETVFTIFSYVLYPSIAPASILCAICDLKARKKVGCFIFAGLPGFILALSQWAVGLFYTIYQSLTVEGYSLSAFALASLILRGVGTLFYLGFLLFEVISSCKKKEVPQG